MASPTTSLEGDKSPETHPREAGNPSAPDRDPLFEELAAIYRDADLTFSGWSCPASTECCRFGITGREPYVTSIEIAALLRARAAAGSPLSVQDERGVRSRGRRALPVAGDGERRCPMLTAEGRCAVYAWRPLGCRTFYCDRAEPGQRVRHREISALVRRIQDLASRHQPGGDQGRALTRALSAPAARSARQP